MSSALSDSLSKSVTAPVAATRERVLRIAPTSGWVSLRLRELNEYRELLYFLVWRDIKVRYKQTALGAAWAVVQPLFTMLVFSLFFGRLAKVPSDGIPYPVFSYAALVPWTFFAHGLTQGSDSLVGSANLIRKVYFPRLLIPLATVLAGLVDFSLAFALLIGQIAFYRIHPPHPLFVVPLILAGACDVAWRGLLVPRAEREVPRREIYGAVFDAVLAVRDAHRVSEQLTIGALAHALRFEPDGGRGGGIPLGAARDQDRPGTDGAGVDLCFARDSGGRSLLFPAYGEDLRRYGLRGPLPSPC